MNEMKKVIIITGCSGRIGRSIINRFKNSSYYLVGLDLVPLSEPPSNFTYIQMDISSQESLLKAMKQIKEQFGNRIASVLDLAAYYSFKGGEWPKYETITIQGTKHLLEALQQFEPEQFVFSSTMLVHAPQDPPAKINENSPLLASWEYPSSKIETEKIIQENHGQIPYVILRIAGCYDDYCHSIPIANQIQRIYENQFAAHVFPGDISHGDTYIHLEDLAEVFWLVVNQRKEIPQECTLLVGEDETLSYDQLQRRISMLIRGKEITTFRIPKWFAKMGAWIQDRLPFMRESFIKPWMIDYADDNYDLDITLMKKTLTWNPSHLLSTTLPLMIQELKENPIEWYKNNDLVPPKWLKKHD